MWYRCIACSFRFVVIAIKFAVATCNVQFAILFLRNAVSVRDCSNFCTNALDAERKTCARFEVFGHMQIIIASEQT